MNHFRYHLNSFPSVLLSTDESTVPRSSAIEDFPNLRSSDSDTWPFWKFLFEHKIVPYDKQTSTQLSTTSLWIYQAILYFQAKKMLKLRASTTLSITWRGFLMVPKQTQILTIYKDQSWSKWHMIFAKLARNTLRYTLVRMVLSLYIHWWT